MRRSVCASLACGVACALAAPRSVLADYTALTSPDQIIGTHFDFDALTVGFVGRDTNAIAGTYGFTFPDAELPGLSGELIAEDSEGGHLLGVFGSALGYDGLVRFEFVDLVYAVGIDYSTSTPLSLIAIDDQGNYINPDGSIQTALDDQGERLATGFFGVGSDVGIRSLLIHDSAGTFRLDNLTFGGAAAVVPVPGAATLAALGFFAVGYLRRKL